MHDTMGFAWRRIRRHTLIIHILVTGLLWPPPSSSQTVATSITTDGYTVLNERAGEARKTFFVYKDAESGFNHGFPSGVFGTPGKIEFDSACIESPSGCSTDVNQIDRNHGTVMRISFAPLSGGQFAGIQFEEPENYGARPRGLGYDLRGATNIVFDVRSLNPGGVRVQFIVGGSTSNFMPIPQSASFSTLAVPLSSFSPPVNLADVHILFGVVTNDVNAPNGGTLLLDNVRFDPLPTSQQRVLGLPLGTETFGVVPVQSPISSRVPIPPDQINRNAASVYEGALTLWALLDRGAPEDLANARILADTLDYALRHDITGARLPVASDGSVALHNAYSAGDIALLNDQSAPAAQGRSGDVRLAGFNAANAGCGASGFCLVMDGTTGGNLSFAMLGFISAYKQFGDTIYLDDARTVGRWIVSMLSDTTGNGFGGYYLGFPDQGLPKILQKGKSTENNADIFAAFNALAGIERSLGNTAQAEQWAQRANIAGDFAMQMVDPAGKFYAGTVPAGTTTGPGISPDGPRRGDDVINTSDLLDSNSFTILALAGSPRYRDRMDWRRPTQFMVDRFAQSVAAGGRTFRGFNISPQPVAGPNGIAWEFTAQVIAAMRFVDILYGESRFESTADAYANEIAQAQASAPFGDGRGVVASTLVNGEQVPVREQCLSTPFQCIPQRVGLAATTWAIFASRRATPLSHSVNQTSAAFVTPARGAYSAVTSGQSSGANVGYARVQAPNGDTPAGLAIFGFRQDNVLVTEASVPGVRPFRSGTIYSEIDGPVNTGLAIANPNNQPATISFFFTDASGYNFGQGETTIAPNAQLAKFLNEPPFNGGSNMKGTFTFTSPVPIAVVALRGFTNERSEFLITTLPVTDLSATFPATSTLFPHFADGAGWTTQIVLINPSTETLTGTAQFFSRGISGSGASPVAVTANGQTSSIFAYSIAPRSSFRLQTSGTAGKTETGSVRISPISGIASPSGVLIFSYSNRGATVTEAGVPLVESGSAFRMYGESSGPGNQVGSIQTGFAIANPGAAEAAVNVELTSVSGAPVMTTSLVVPAFGQVAEFLSEAFPSLSTFQGIVRISTNSSAGISAIGLRGRYNERDDFLITTTPPVNENAPPGAGELLFPHIVDGGGYSTQFVLFGAAGQPSAATIRFVSQIGGGLGLRLGD